MANFYNYTKGMGNVGSYLISGIPYATGSIGVANSSGTPTEIDFPKVTRFVTIRNGDSSNTLRVGFSENGVKGSVDNYYHIVGAASSVTLDIRVANIYLLGDSGTCSDVSVAAGLTGISDTELPTNWTGSIGVG